MSVKNEFVQTLKAVEQVLDQAPTQEAVDPKSIRSSIKQIVTAYVAKDVVKHAYSNFSDSGVVQWKAFLRSANVKQNEPMDAYLGRVRESLSGMERFSAVHLKI